MAESPNRQSAYDTDSLRRVFTEVFTARDIAEPLVSVDSTALCEAATSLMERHDFDLIGVRENGLILGYASSGELVGENCGSKVLAFDPDSVISDEASFVEVVRGLQRSPRLFVKAFGTVGGIITMHDLQKPAVRMWLFGMVTLIESRLTTLIDRFCPDDSWQTYLSDGRREKAAALQAERRRRNHHVKLVACLQFSDKGQILYKNTDLRQRTRFQSRRQMEDLFKRLEQLRNHLAHAQDMVVEDWETILQLVDNLEQIIRGPAAS